MALSRISAISAALPARHQGEQARAGVGEILQLVLADGDAGNALARTSAGQTLRLNGLDLGGQRFSAGETLLVRVLANTPAIELEILEVIPPVKAEEKPGVAAPFDQAAMRPDQAVMAQLAGRTPTAAMLAASWQALVYGHVLPAGVRQGPPIPPGCYGAAGTECMTDAAMQRVIAAPDGGRWMFPLGLPDGTASLLRIEDAEDGSPGHSAARSYLLVLRIDLILPEMGHVAILAQYRHGGIVLTLAFARKEAGPAFRRLLPELETALVRAGLMPLRCVLIHGLPGVSRHAPFSRSILPAPALFRALAESVLFLGSKCA